MPGWIERGITPLPRPVRTKRKKKKVGRKRPPTTTRVQPPTNLEKALRDLKIRHFDRDILNEMTLDEIREHFGYKPKAASPDRPKASKKKKKKPRKPKSEFKIEILLKNVIWQIYERIRGGWYPEFVKRKGNIRGLWYYIKTRFHRHKPLRGMFYKTMIKMLARMVEAGVVSYADFKFRDLAQNEWHIGPENRHAIILCEKDSFAYYTEEYVATYGCCALTMGGSPSLMSVDYFVQRLAEAGVDLTQKFVLISIVDYDPRGEDAANDFVEKLELFGVRNFHRFRQYESSSYKRLDLIQPKHLTDDESALEGGGLTYTLPKSQWKSKLGRSWFSRTGGVGGNRKLGLESDECTGERIHQLLVEHFVPLLQTDIESVQRRREVRRLRRALSNVLVFKQTGVLPDDTVRRQPGELNLPWRPQPPPSG
ncbi:MAG: hypothetical protein AB1646_20575 [Thermodesulfobacteriota bacterium]